MKLLLIAADPREFAGIPKPRAFPIPGVHWSRTARAGSHDALLIANGAGSRRASEATTLAAQRFQPDAVVSTGFCGALDRSLRIGDIVVATKVLEDSVVTDAASPSSMRRFHAGPVTTINHVAGSSTEKAHLSASGAIAVEMEAAGVAQAAASLRLPFFCIRTVTDLALEDMANDFNAALRSDGHFDTIKVLTGALCHPVARVPELLRMRDRAERAAQSLGAFLVDCRF